MAELSSSPQEGNQACIYTLSLWLEKGEEWVCMGMQHLRYNVRGAGLKNSMDTEAHVHPAGAAVYGQQHALILSDDFRARIRIRIRMCTCCKPPDVLAELGKLVSNFNMHALLASSSEHARPHLINLTEIC